MSRRRAGARFHGTKRQKVLPGVKANYNPVQLASRVFRALADGPGGQTVREALRRSVSWTVGPKGAHWNSRTDRITVNTPGFGSVSAPARLRSQGRRRGPATRRRTAQQRSGQRR